MCNIVSQITAKDRDFRYMATSDLLKELEKDSFRVDPDTERKLCAAMINQLEDTSGDITGLAVKWCVVCSCGALQAWTCNDAAAH